MDARQLDAFLREQSDFERFMLRFPPYDRINHAKETRDSVCDVKIERYPPAKNPSVTRHPLRISSPGLAGPDRWQTVYHYYDGISLLVHPRFSFSCLVSHDAVELVYVYSGAHSINVSGAAIDMAPGDCCLIAPNAAHTASVLGDNDIVVSFKIDVAYMARIMCRMAEYGQIFGFIRGVCMPGQLAAGALGQTGTPGRTGQTGTPGRTGQTGTPGQPGRLGTPRQTNQQASGSHALLIRSTDGRAQDAIIAQMLCEYFEPSGYYEEAVASYLNIVFATLERSANSQAAARCGAPDDTWRSDVLQYIRKERGNASLIDTARRFGYNPRYFSEKLRRQTGLTFSELAHEERLKWACLLLEGTDAPVAEIAHEIGYMDASSFFRMFMKKRSQTPLQYRRARSNRSV